MSRHTLRRTPCPLCGRGVPVGSQFRVANDGPAYHYNCIREAHRRGDIPLDAMPTDALFGVTAGIEDRGPEWRPQ